MIRKWNTSNDESLTMVISSNTKLLDLTKHECDWLIQLSSHISYWKRYDWINSFINLQTIFWVVETERYWLNRKHHECLLVKLERITVGAN